MAKRLAGLHSLYLKQHQDDPVDWWPYTQEAIEQAKKENKPIFLSIGYSSCHWCHVMAKESFSDHQTAEFLNQHFIAIKVDKEEHPDLDQYYQGACQMFSGRGGWPLSVFTLPDMRPFYAGTYFPKHPQQGVTSFLQVLEELKNAYHSDYQKVEENAVKVSEALAQGFQDKQKVEFQGHFPAPSSILEAIDKFADKGFGGYGKAPKFPQFAFYEWACEQMLEGMVEKPFGEHIVHTLERLFMGGVFDQARGGIHRYSTDDRWHIPHFEKMLYDQAGVLRLLSKFSLLYPSPLIYDHLANTLNYLHREMIGDKGYFFSAQDADSEEMEGLYFTYTEEEFEDLVNRASEQQEQENALEFDMELMKKWFSITAQGNFKDGLNALILNYDLRKDIFSEEGMKKVRAIRQAALEMRKLRIPPSTDNKGVSSWNFMMISALVDVMQYCRIASIRKMASGIFNQVMQGSYETFVKIKEESGKKMSSLIHSTTCQQNIPLLEDFVFFAESQLRVYELTGNKTFKENSQQTIELIVREFFNNEKRPQTRAIHTEMPIAHPNQEAPFFDTSFRSPVATLITTIRRLRVLFKDRSLYQQIDSFIEEYPHAILKNPMAAGEGLRALSYPDAAYKVVQVPVKWLSQEKFLNFMPYFMPRFVLDYHNEKNEQWQICSLKECEIHGSGLDQFIERLAPAKNDK